MYVLTRKLFPVAFEWGRLALLPCVIGGVAVAGELLLPTDGRRGFALRTLALRRRSCRSCAAAGFFRHG